MKCLYPLNELTFFSILFSAGTPPRVRSTPRQSSDWISRDYFESDAAASPVDPNERYYRVSHIEMVETKWL